MMESVTFTSTPSPIVVIFDFSDVARFRRCEDADVHFRRRRSLGLVRVQLENCCVSDGWKWKCPAA